MDKLVTCRRCEGNACYEQIISEDVTTWLCMGCGFTTSTLLTEDSSVHNSAKQSSPELYNDLAFKDDEGYIWYPATITVPEKGMVFIDGTSSNDWQWSAVKAIRIQDSERDKFPEGQDFRMDMQNVSHFNKKDFMDALEAIDFYKV